ncbi:MAG: peptidyl-prolyl cis-trans isomerase [Gemmataceae bacterium]|nr:peptidyl-prolyl cis-trans isomerase [Gemmataceae bacterium]
MAGLFVAVLGGGFLVFYLLRSGSGPVVVIETSAGTIRAELFEADAPITVKNFLRYVDRKTYDGTIFHRVIPNFMIQGGGFEPGEEMKERPTYAPIRNESYNGLRNERGTLAMARTNDPDSATAQFYINLVDNKSLDRGRGNPGYAVFGKVIEGMDVVDKIARVEIGRRGPHDDVPREDIIIKSIRRAASE